MRSHDANGAERYELVACWRMENIEGQLSHYLRGCETLYLGDLEIQEYYR